MQVQSMEREINLMQEHLPALRKIAGWTAAELGEKLGLKKQAITSIESKNANTTKLSQAQYIALRFLFETEAVENNNEALKIVLNILFNNTEEYEKDKEEIDKRISLIAGAATGAATLAVASSATAALGILAIPLFAPLAAITGGTLAATLGAKLLKLGKKK